MYSLYGAHHLSSGFRKRASKPMWTHHPVLCPPEVPQSLPTVVPGFARAEGLSDKLVVSSRVQGWGKKDTLPSTLSMGFEFLMGQSLADIYVPFFPVPPTSSYAFSKRFWHFSLSISLKPWFFTCNVKSSFKEELVSDVCSQPSWKKITTWLSFFILLMWFITIIFM